MKKKKGFGRCLLMLFISVVAVVAIILAVVNNSSQYSSASIRTISSELLHTSGIRAASNIFSASQRSNTDVVATAAVAAFDDTTVSSIVINIKNLCLFVVVNLLY